MNQFGGNWTERKMEIVVAYAKAYLMIMNTQRWVKTLYFDGFAGSGTITDVQDFGSSGIVTSNLFGEETSATDEAKKGTALRILDLHKPKPFDLYYFVEKNEEYQKQLKLEVQTKYPDRAKSCSIVKGDCNQKIRDMAAFLRNNREYRSLAFVDPYGMSVNWSSIESLKGLGVDLWILVPSGVGANRVLVKDGEIPDTWQQTLESFLGLDRISIRAQFYREVTISTLFDADVTLIAKERDTVNKIGKLYSNRLKDIFKYVSEPFVMRNSTNSIMYHFMMATNNVHALGIANDVIKPKYKI